MSPTPEVCADFVGRFATFWSAPDPEALPQLLSEDVHLEAPLTPPTDGMEAAKGIFEGLLALYPDLHAVVHRWGPHPDGLFIECTLLATTSTGQMTVRAIDDFIVGDDGLATERVSYFDPAHLLAPD